MPPSRSQKINVLLLVIVASLGYFVDIYDLLIFSIVRVSSLQDIGIPAENIRPMGEYVLNMQMGGLLTGGILWGIMGDKCGRIRVLFGSILLYSIANIANSFVQNIDSYATIRFIAGIGLAGELGAGITLVSETMSRHKRGYGTMIVAVVGVLGAVAAREVARCFDWRKAYIVGGVLGLVLLLLRMGTLESGMYKSTAQASVPKGSLRMLLRKDRLRKYIYCILIGLPLWFVVGILITQAPEFGKALGAAQPLDAGTAVMYTYIGISAGDILAGLLAQLTRSRRLVILCFCLASLIATCCYLGSTGITPEKFSRLAFIMGLAVGYWATFVTIASEQFGTNLRATVATTVPNFVRGALIPITFVFEFFAGQYGIVTAAYILSFALTAVSLFSLSRLKETFGKDLNYHEEDPPIFM